MCCSMLVVQVLLASGRLATVCTCPAAAWAVLDDRGAPAKAVLPDGALVDIASDTVEALPAQGDDPGGALRLRLADGQTVRHIHMRCHPNRQP